MTDLTELVARAICCPENKLCKNAGWACDAPNYEVEAQAALKALSDAGYVVVLREPTAAMMNAEWGCENIPEMWQAMIKEFEDDMAD